MINRVILSIFLLFVFNLDYDPALVPIVYPENDVEPSTLESEIERQLEEKHLNPSENELDGEQDTHKPDEKVNHSTPPLYQDYLTTTTTIRPTKRRLNKQDSVCKLPAQPESDVEFDAGYRFGTVIDSRIEFNDVPAKIKKSYEISLEFKTNQPDGVLFYAADSRHTDFIVLYLQDGYVSIYLINLITSTRMELNITV